MVRMPGQPGLFGQQSQICGYSFLPTPCARCFPKAGNESGHKLDARVPTADGNAPGARKCHGTNWDFARPGRTCC